MNTFPLHPLTCERYDLGMCAVVPPCPKALLHTRSVCLQVSAFIAAFPWSFCKTFISHVGQGGKLRAGCGHFSHSCLIDGLQPYVECYHSWLNTRKQNSFRIHEQRLQRGLDTAIQVVIADLVTWGSLGANSQVQVWFRMLTSGDLGVTEQER